MTDSLDSPAVTTPQETQFSVSLNQLHEDAYLMWQATGITLMGLFKQAASDDTLTDREVRNIVRYLSADPINDRDIQRTMDLTERYGWKLSAPVDHAAITTSQETMKPPTLISSIDEIKAYGMRPCVRCGCSANTHLHLYGSNEWLCPTVARFIEPLTASVRAHHQPTCPTHGLVDAAHRCRDFDDDTPTIRVPEPPPWHPETKK